MSRLLAFLCLITVLGSCSWLNKTPREKYERELKKNDTELFAKWEADILSAMEQEAAPRLPYAAKGQLNTSFISAYSFNIKLETGERFKCSFSSNTPDTRLFAELYQITDDPEKPYDRLSTSGKNNEPLIHEVTTAGEYKILIAGEANVEASYQVFMDTQPIYRFPVAGARNTDIKSFWGADRDGGKRSHEGIDIFADRGTDLLAVTDGKIQRREGGLGGKQIWLYDRERRIRVYYAHLDEQVAKDGAMVRAGDVVGKVGNTGNARTTPPHLHFGTYLSKRGAVNPLGFVKTQPKAVLEINPNLKELTLAEVNTSRLNLRAATYKNAPVITELTERTPLLVFAASGDHYHVRTPSGDAGFVVGSSIK